MRCEICGTELQAGECLSCQLYNAAVRAQKAAAKSIARDRGAEPSHLNETGVYGWRDGQCMLIATAEEAAPFAALTTRARAVRYQG
jgi:hypothetical protein